MTDVWPRLVDALRARQAHTPVLSPRARVGAVLALLAPVGERADDLELVYTRRRDDLANHPGQVSFPGGRVEPGEGVDRAALREAAEEVALDPATVTVVGHLPAFFVPPSRFWIRPVVGRWERPHELRPAEAEVAEVVRARVSLLTDPSRWRAVRLSASGWSWAWQLDERHLLWGATAMVTTQLLDALVPGWHRQVHPDQLAAERAVQPWRGGRRTAGVAQPVRLPGLPVRAVEAVAWDGPDGPPPDSTLPRWGELAADAVRRLAATPGERVLVLAGAGGNGRLGLATGAALRRGGWDVRVVMAGVPALPTVPGVTVQAFDGTLVDADLVVDALVGGGLRGALRGVPRDMLLALRHQDVPVVALDVPTGLHPSDGLIGDAVAADVTVALGGPRRGLFGDGLAPFVGDLYLATVQPDRSLVRLVRRDDRSGGGWRE